MRTWTRKCSYALQIAGVALCLSLVAAPSMATNAVPLPEPGTLSLIAFGIAAVILASRFRRRK